MKDKKKKSNTIICDVKKIDDLVKMPLVLQAQLMVIEVLTIVSFDCRQRICP